MNISSRCEYACRAMIELARNENSETPLTTIAMAERRQIPEKYLVHILLQLKRAGLVRSVRGSQGGYHLAKAAHDISLYDIVSSIDGSVLDPLPVEDAAGADLALMWRDVGTQIEKFMSNVTLRQILDRAQKSSMYYI